MQFTYCVWYKSGSLGLILVQSYLSGVGKGSHRKLYRSLTSDYIKVPGSDAAGDVRSTCGMNWKSREVRVWQVELARNATIKKVAPTNGCGRHVAEDRQQKLHHAVAICGQRKSGNQIR